MIRAAPPNRTGGHLSAGASGSRAKDSRRFRGRRDQRVWRCLRRALRAFVTDLDLDLTTNIAYAARFLEKPDDRNESRDGRCRARNGAISCVAATTAALRVHGGRHPFPRHDPALQDLRAAVPCLGKAVPQRGGAFGHPAALAGGQHGGHGGVRLRAAQRGSGRKVSRALAGCS